MKKIIPAVCFLLAFVAVSAQSTLKTVELNVFKNGTYFIAKEGNVPLKKGVATLELPEKPLMATYWLTATKENKISYVHFLSDTIKKTKSPQNFNDIFKGSVGKKVKLTFMNAPEKATREITGILSGFIENSNIAKIKLADNKTTYVSISNILEFTIEDTGVDNLVIDSLVRVAKVNFEKSNATADMRLVYIEAGIQWFPQYDIKIINENELQLEMKALVENYAEDIANAELTLTVGNPQFYYGSSLDPIYNNYLTSLYIYSPYSTTTLPAAQQYNFQSNVITTTDRSYNEIPAYEEYGEYNTDGEKSNDLYMYKLGLVSLPKESKASYQIFTVKIPYKDIYEVSIGDVVNYSYYSYIGNDPEQRFEVYHSLKLTNNTTFPFTTAPVFVQNEKLQPMAQDRITYTPTGGNVSVQLSKAGDVMVKNKEEEVKKEDNVKKIGKTYYNKVTVKGVISVENMQNKKIQLIIKKNILALVTQMSDGGKAVKSGKYKSLNPYTDISWEVPLNAGEKKNISYEYEVYAPAGGGY